MGVVALSGEEGNEGWTQEWQGEDRPVLSFLDAPTTPAGSAGDLVEAVVGGQEFASYESIKGGDGTAWNHPVLWGRLGLFDEHIAAPQPDGLEAPEAVLLFGHDADIQQRFLLQSARFLLDEGVLDAEDPRVSDLFVDDGQGGSWLPWVGEEWGAASPIKMGTLTQIMEGA